MSGLKLFFAAYCIPWAEGSTTGLSGRGIHKVAAEVALNELAQPGPMVVQGFTFPG